MRTNTAARVGALMLIAEGFALLALAVWQGVVLGAGDVGSLPSGIALVVLTVVVAVAVGAFGLAVLRDRSWGRSGGIVAQLMIGAVAVGAMTGSYAHPLLGVALIVVAVVAITPLLLEVRRAGARDRDEDD